MAQTIGLLSMPCTSNATWSNELERRLAAQADGRVDRPKYRRLAEALAAMINEGYWQVDDLLPREAELASYCRFGLSTVQRALGSLVELGMIRRIRRVGTQVCRPTQEILDIWQFRFVNPENNKLYPIYSSVIGVHVCQEPGPWRSFLSAHSELLEVARIVRISDVAQVFSRFMVPKRGFESLLDMPANELEGVHLSAVIQRLSSQATLRTRNRISRQRWASEVGVCLQTEQHEGMVCDVLGYGISGRPLSFQRIYLPDDIPPIEFHERHPRING